MGTASSESGKVDRAATVKVEEKFLQKSRLCYVRETYCSDLGGAELQRRLAGQTVKGQGEATGFPEYLVLQGEDRVFPEYRSIQNYFDLNHASVANAGLIGKICGVLARHAIWRSNGSLTAPDADLVEKATRGLADFVQRGSGSPFFALTQERFPAIELSFEHLQELEQPKADGSAFGALAAMARGSSVARSYLRGEPVDDWAVYREVAIDRPVERRVAESIAIDQARITLLVGAAGDGRTTIARRLAMCFRERGWRVFFISRPRPHQSFARLPDFDCRETPTLLVVDNIEQADDIQHLEEDVLSQPNLRLLITARAHLWHAKGMHLSRAVEIELPRLSEAEFGPLAEVILKHEAASGAGSKELLEGRLRQSIDSNYPHLLAAMLTATSGKSFEATIASMIDDFERVGDDGCLRFVSAFSFLSEFSLNASGRLSHRALRASLEGDLRQRHPGGDIRTLANEMLRRVRSEVISLPVTGGFWKTTEYDLRHPDIVRLVVNRFYGSSDDGYCRKSRSIYRRHSDRSS